MYKTRYLNGQQYSENPRMFYYFLRIKSSWLNIWNTSVVLIFLLISLYLKFFKGGSYTNSNSSIGIKKSGSLIILAISYSVI